MTELADVRDLGFRVERRVGSSPISDTTVTTLVELNVQGLWASHDAHKPLYDNAGA